GSINNCNLAAFDRGISETSSRTVTRRVGGRPPGACPAIWRGGFPPRIRGLDDRWHEPERPVPRTCGGGDIDESRNGRDAEAARRSVYTFCAGHRERSAGRRKTYCQCDQSRYRPV